VTGSDDHTARLWNAATGWGVAVLAGHTDSITAVAFSQEGTRIVTGSRDKTARLWDATTGEPVTILAGHAGAVEAVAFPTGTRVLTGADDNIARLWDAAAGRMVATLTGHTGFISGVAFSPDGTRVLTGFGDGAARLWDVATGKVVATLAGHRAWVNAVAFAQDGTRVLTGFGDTARLWPVFQSAQALINTVRTTLPRCLTPIQREEFHLGTPPPRWCYERNLWPFADHGQPYTEGGSPPYGPPPPTWDEKLLAAWDWIGSWFGSAAAKQESR
jgi:WD40 repeat protein